MTFCPHCGTNVTPDEPITIGTWDLLPREAYHNAVRVRITPQEASLLHTLAKAQGRAVNTETVGLRISDAEDPGNLAAVTVRHLRIKLGKACPVETVRYEGYRFKGGEE